MDGNDDSTNDSNLTQAINDLAMKGRGATIFLMEIFVKCPYLI